MTQQKKTSAGNTEGTKRADALRNETMILEAAKTIFAQSGVDAPVREIAKAAGVGVGTIYRRFPKRFDLVAAVFRREMDICVKTAEGLTQQYSSLEALKLWLLNYADFMATKKGLSVALHSGDPAFDGMQEYFKSRFEPTLTNLLSLASDDGAVRDDIDAYDLLRAIGNISLSAADSSAHTKRMVLLMIDGLCKVN